MVKDNRVNITIEIKLLYCQLLTLVGSGGGVGGGVGEGVGGGLETSASSAASS